VLQKPVPRTGEGLCVTHLARVAERVATGRMVRLSARQLSVIDGTLLREQKGTPRLEGPRHGNSLPPAGGVDPGVYLVDNQKLRRVTSTTAMEENCLPWRHVRTVPENTLADLEPGPDIGP
jgi:hypothetical protein